MQNANAVYESIEDACLDMPDADFPSIVKVVAWYFNMGRNELLFRYPDAKRSFYRGMARWWLTPFDAVENVKTRTSIFATDVND